MNPLLGEQDPYTFRLPTTEVHDLVQESDFSQQTQEYADLAASREDDGEDEDKKGKRRKRGRVNNGSENSDARRESHKLIEQKRRQKINEKINELRQLLNYPDGSQNKAVVLQAAVESIRHLKLMCNKMLMHHRQLQEEHLHVLAENERLRKMLDPNAKTNEQQSIQSQHMQQLENLGTTQSEKIMELSGTLKPASSVKPMNSFTPVDILRSGSSSHHDLQFLYGQSSTNMEPESHGVTMMPMSLQPRNPYQTGSPHQSNLVLNSAPSLPLPSHYPLGPNSLTPVFGSESTLSIPPLSGGTNTNSSHTQSTASTSGPSNQGQNPLTSTETENGVSITRLLFSGS